MAPYIPSVTGSEAVAWFTLERQPAKGNAPARIYGRVGWRHVPSNPVARQREIRHVNLGNINTLGDLRDFEAAFMPAFNDGYLAGATPNKNMAKQLRAAALETVRSRAAGEDPAVAAAALAELVATLVADAAAARQAAEAEAEAEAGAAEAGNPTDVLVDVLAAS